MDSSFSALWQRIGDRRHTLVVGAPPPAVPPSVAAHVVRVSCDDRDRPLAPVVDLARRIEARLNLEPSGPASGLPYPLRDRLRGEPRPRGPAVRALEALQALGSAGRCTVIFEHLERADVATLRLLRLLLWRPELKNVPFVLHFADRPGDDDGAAFFGALLDTLGPEGVVRAAASPETRFVGAADVLTILRAAALLGPVADVALVAAVVERTQAAVLEALQQAFDAGLGVGDRGDGSFRLSEQTAQQLTDGILPSLAAHWHERAGALLRERERSASSRAAHHYERLGHSLEVVREHVRAARAANQVGAAGLALRHVELAARRADELDDGDESRVLRAAALVEQGVAQCQALGPDGPLDLEMARATLEEGARQLRPGDPPRLLGRVSAALASCLLELGDLPSLESALRQLADASRALAAANAPIEAARLLNDQAAVYVRLGDPVRAHRLLEESRRAFDARARTDPDAALELAETELLIARLPLHVDSRPGREEDAVAAGLLHAEAAERTFTELRVPRGLGKTWETMGRLHLLGGDLASARDRLARAAELQARIDDGMGLARTAAVLGDVAQAEGRFSDALAALERSIQLNAGKGSPLGLAFNRDALEALADALPPAADEARETVARLGVALEEAEAAIEAHPLPPSL